MAAATAAAENAELIMDRLTVAVTAAVAVQNAEMMAVADLNVVRLMVII